MRNLLILISCCLLPQLMRADDRWLEFPGGDGPGKGKHIVLVSGDHEYRSEEAFPQLGKILSKHLGFRCTVLFPIDPQTGEINPESVTNIPGLEALEDADLVVLGLRFRNLEDDQMKRIVDYAEAGKPLMALRTSTHPFNIPKDRKYHQYTWNSQDPANKGGFERKSFGETWVSHYGKHGRESTRGLVADAKHPIATGIKDGDIWGPTDVYEVKLPLTGDGHPVIFGQILSGMSPESAPVTDARSEKNHAGGVDPDLQRRSRVCHHDGLSRRPTRVKEFEECWPTPHCGVLGWKTKSRLSKTLRSLENTHLLHLVLKNTSQVSVQRITTSSRLAQQVDPS